VFALGMAFLVLAMTKERDELRYRTAARTDPLTGIANRRAFMDGAARLIERRSHTGAPVAVLLFDLDHFKQINDAHGHFVGDQVLQSFATIALEGLRPGDLLGRLGGEEFAALLPDVSPQGAFAVAERVRAAVAVRCAGIAGRPVAATVSVGVAAAELPLSLGPLLEAADAALYRAKASGRNRVKTARLGEPREAVLATAAA
jgi:diguanylate cyclase (GGDEF)-like protein